MQSNRNRISLTFFGYVIIVLIPLTILVYQGVAALKNHKGEIEKNVLSRLRSVGSGFEADLKQEWQDFLEEEKLRKFYHYQPLIVPDQDSFFARSDPNQRQAVQRSPLYRAIDHLANLNYVNSDDASDPDLAATEPPTTRQVIQQSLIGYFQFDPHNEKMISPYRDGSGTVAPALQSDTVEQYHQFLDNYLTSLFRDRWDLDKKRQRKSGVTPSNILPRDKPKPIFDEEEFAANLLRFSSLYDDFLEGADGLTVLGVSYFDFSFETYNYKDHTYILCFRPVVLVLNKRSRILIQGFMFNRDRIIEKARAHIEPSQPQFGRVTFGNARPRDGNTLFPPFNSVALGLEKGDPKVYLQDYHAEKNRFLGIIVLLLVAMGVSLVHLGSIIYGNIQLDKKKGNFISAITHELKAPLTSIIMYAEMLEEGWVKGKEATYYRHIRSESERLSRLIKNILDYSGIERGIFKLKKTSLLLHGFLEETLEPLKVWIESNDLFIDLKINAMPYVIADKDSLSQVIYNLIDNTIKYGRPISEASILTIIVDEDRSHAILRVYDNGPGVSKLEEDKVFNRFYRCENEMTRESTGTGLGLALVKELVEGNGGTIQVSHPPNATGFGVKIAIPKLVIDSSMVSRPAPS